MDML